MNIIILYTAVENKFKRLCKMQMIRYVLYLYTCMYFKYKNENIEEVNGTSIYELVMKH